MSRINLRPIAERIADAILAEPRGRRAADRRQRIVAIALPLLAEAVAIGLDKVIVAADAQKRALTET